MFYLGRKANSPVLPELFEAMQPPFRDEWGNSRNAYRFGAKPKATIGAFREQAANLIGALWKRVGNTLRTCG